MSIHRRGFLAGLAGGAAALGCKPAAAPPKVDAWSDVRALFALSPEWIHMSALLLVSHPKPVRDAIDRLRRALDADPVRTMHEHEGTWRMHEAAAAYMGVRREEIALTDSTTMGLGVVCGGLELKPGDEILTSTHDHYSLHEATRLTGATVRRVPMWVEPSQATDAEMLASITKNLGEATRLVAMTWVHSSTGVKVPVPAIAAAIASLNAQRPPERRILLLVDGVHGFGVESESIPSLGCDVFVAGCHKWLFGPRGTGVIWARSDVWPLLQPTIPAFAAGPFDAWKRGAPAPPTSAFGITPGGYHSFEHRWALPEAFELHLAIGKERIRDRTHALNRALKQGLAAMKHVTLRTPLDDARSAGIVCFDVKGLEPDAVVKRLEEQRIVATATANTPSHARLSAAIFNTEDEVERVLSAIAALA